ncbi:MAG: hypothetical protein QOF26_2828 [Baekduia sp.]|nr:hypothetical protein [Baekduia sp.]
MPSRRWIWRSSTGSIARTATAARRTSAIADAWLSCLARDVFPGGCFITAASCEFDDRSGRVRDAIAALHGEWMAVLARDARQAVADGDLPRGTLPEDVAFTMNAIAMGVNQGRHLLRDADAPARGWRAFRMLLLAPRARRRWS